MERATLGLSPRSFTPRRYQRRMSGWGQALSTCLGLRSRQHRSTLLSASPLATCDLVSHEVPVVGQRRLAPPGDMGLARADACHERRPHSRRHEKVRSWALPTSTSPKSRPWPPRPGKGGAMSSLDWPALKRTTGTPDRFARALELRQHPRVVRFNTAGEGMGLPRSNKNFTTPPSYINPGTYPRIPMRSTEVQRKLTRSASTWLRSPWRPPLRPLARSECWFDQAGRYWGPPSPARPNHHRPA